MSTSKKRYRASTRRPLGIRSAAPGQQWLAVVTSALNLIAAVIATVSRHW